MPYKIKLERPPAGYSLNSSLEGGEVQVAFREFISSEDGMLLINRLEGFPSDIIRMLPVEAGVKCSQIDHLIAHFDRNGDTTVYVNELAISGIVRLRNPVEKGQALYVDDVVDMEQLHFEGIEIPPEHSVLVILSKGWRKALFFDFGPTAPTGQPRSYDLWAELGQCYNYLTYQEVLSLTEEVWDTLFAAKWFPFVGLGMQLLKEMLAWSTSGHSVDEVLPKASAEIRERLPVLRNQWATCSVFSGHLELLNTAADRFEAKDWVSVSSIIYPRIEGILRNFAQTTDRSKLGQSNLAIAPATNSSLPSVSRVLPDKFHRYLKEIYFHSFDPAVPPQISRNSVGHGVAPPSEFSEKAAVIGFLIIEQLFFHVPPARKQKVGDINT